MIMVMVIVMVMVMVTVVIMVMMVMVKEMVMMMLIIIMMVMAMTMVMTMMIMVKMMLSFFGLGRRDCSVPGARMARDALRWATLGPGRRRSPKPKRCLGRRHLMCRRAHWESCCGGDTWCRHLWSPWEL